MSAEPDLRALGVRALSRLLSRSPRARELAVRIGWAPPENRVRWFGARSVAEATQVLVTRAATLLGGEHDRVLIVGRDSTLRRQVHARLSRRDECTRVLPGTNALVLQDEEAARLACIVCTETETAALMRIARAALVDPRLAQVPFEYVTGLEPEHRQLRDQDEYAEQTFISPVLLAQPSPYELYAESLERFEQKCGLRDYLDLFQLLVSVHQRRVPGAVAEFGSYRGHSGWLIGRTLQALGSDRPVRLFDTFESFPVEQQGIDYFWSDSHRVQFEEVRSKLAELPAVALVRGEFEHSLPASGLDEIALAYVDCDSHRAVSYLARELFEDRLSPGGVIVFEDYGHPALLGCRVAVHEYFDDRSDCVKFFSQFSGLYIVVKLSAGRP